jgi:hypothetical protein
MTPVYALVVWAALRHYRGRVSLAAFDRGRAARSWIWSVALVALCAQFLLDGWRALSHAHWADALHSLLGAYLLLCARSSVCAPPAMDDSGGGEILAADTHDGRAGIQAGHPHRRGSRTEGSY